MILSYSLSMPNCGSWDGKWSQSGRLFAIVRAYRGKRGTELAKKILGGNPYRYHWDDGWSALVRVVEVDSCEAAATRRKTAGFAGYDWMVDSIERDQTIVAPRDRIVVAQEVSA